MRGFDRLVGAGFSEDDIANFRRTFHSQSTRDYLDMDIPDDEDDGMCIIFSCIVRSSFWTADEHARELEERWIESLDGGNSSLGLSPPSTSVLKGVLMGFFFPLMPFFFLRDTHHPIFWEDGSVQESTTSSVVFSYVPFYNMQKSF